MKRRARRLILVFLVLVSALPLGAQRIKEMEFRNQAITDILLALGQSAGRSVVPDETVTGTASYYFSETDFDTALRIFLSTYKMYAWNEGGVSYVSRVRALHDRATGNLTLDAEDVDLQVIVRAFSRALGRTVLFDPLPRETLTLHVENAPPARVLEILLRKFPDYQVVAASDFFYLHRTDAGPGQPGRAGTSASSFVTVKDGSFAVHADKVKFRDVLIDLFQKAGFEYSLFVRGDALIESFHFTGKAFEEILRLLLEQAAADYSVANGVYYVYDIQRADVLKKLKTVRQIPLTYVSVQDLPGLFPPEMAGQNLYRLDRNTNCVILTGSGEEIDPIEEFIRRIDQPLQDKGYFRFDLSFLKVNDLLALLPPPLAGVKPIALPPSNSFVALLNEDGKKALDQFLPLVDRKQPAFPIQLRYIQSEQLLKNLPPSVSKDDLQQSGDSSLLFFTGSELRRAQFLRELALLDRPAPQIRYELLVVQYDGSEGLDWNISAENKIVQGNPSSAYLGSIGKLLSLNFDIVSSFGYLFAVKLNLSLGTNRANVLADTTLNGLSGQELKFQNTTTFRYRELEVDSETGKLQPTGVTKEIASGLIIGMNGWVSGDGMITMKVTSTVSKQGEAESTAAGNPPPTSEKVVSTNVRTPSGTPIVIGGLIQQQKTSVVNKIPVLGDIPLLGLLFQSRSDKVENTELVIYIVPHVEFPEMRKADAGLRMEELYTALVKNGTGG